METKIKPVRTLTCCCCGGETRGRQWWNRDTGYGLCVDCIDFCHRGVNDATFADYYGERGVHFDVVEA